MDLKRMKEYYKDNLKLEHELYKYSDSDIALLVIKLGNDEVFAIDVCYSDGDVPVDITMEVLQREYKEIFL